MNHLKQTLTSSKEKAFQLKKKKQITSKKDSKIVDAIFLYKHFKN